MIQDPKGGNHCDDMAKSRKTVFYKGVKGVYLIVLRKLYFPVPSRNIHRAVKAQLSGT